MESPETTRRLNIVGECLQALSDAVKAVVTDLDEVERRVDRMERMADHEVRIETADAPPYYLNGGRFKVKDEGDGGSVQMGDE